MSDPLLDINDLTVRYRAGDREITAVSDASLELSHGEHSGVVGESGCGKSTLAKAVLGGLDENGFVESGEIKYKGQNIEDKSEEFLNEHIRWKEISYIPQGSLDSLDPLRKVSDQAISIAKKHTDMSEAEALDQFKEMFEIVGLPESRIHDYPHQFSGGMQQRGIIALALFLEPSLVIADEPTTALDVIMQDQIFYHIRQIKERLDTSMLLITHDMSLVLESCSSMSVMHSGQVVESGPTEALFDSPSHPYTILLQRAFPDIRTPDQELETIEGYPPETEGEIDFCTFADRCPWAVEECRTDAPAVEIANGGTNTGDTQHTVSCVRHQEALDLYKADRAADAPIQGGHDNDD